MEKISVTKILEHAIEIEEMGQKFYTLLTERLDDPQLKKIFSLMSRQEVGHGLMYKKMLAEFPESPLPAPTESESFDLKKHEMLEDSIFNRMEIVRKTPNLHSLVDALSLMIEIEINVVDYFENVRRLVRLQDQANMEKIINEEKSHVRQLVDLRTQYKNTRLRP